MNLINIPINTVVCIDELKFDNNDKLLNRLKALGFIEGAKIKKTFIAPLGDPIIIEILGTKMAIRKKDAAKISIVSVNNDFSFEFLNCLSIGIDSLN